MHMIFLSARILTAPPLGRITHRPGVAPGRLGTAITIEHSFSINHFLCVNVQNYLKLRFKEYQGAQNLRWYCKENGQSLIGGPHGQDQERQYGTVNTWPWKAQNSVFLSWLLGATWILNKPLRYSCSAMTTVARYIRAATAGDVFGLKSLSAVAEKLTGLDFW